ncbi:MAG: FAD:protein FMN transferase [Gammaproteobacteria bacterium]|nr:FAD:protein FMN transferase [Gammaproteobacteria bacterium]
MAARFASMGSPCEVLVATPDPQLALRLGQEAAAEAWRIECKYSRYRPDSVIGRINATAGQPIELDAETTALLNYAAQCFELSDGRFDITSGVLRRAWTFDGSDRLPEAGLVNSLLARVGFRRLRWEAPWLQLRRGMELDLGGIGKEYAVDRAHALLGAISDVPYLVNFGGDLRCNRAPPDDPWCVGVERPDREGEARLLLDLERGALTTSGDARRFLLRDGVRYGHILDPRTGWPVVGAPRSVTVCGSSCSEAGLLSTLAMLYGAGARAFLAEHGAPHWIVD